MYTDSWKPICIICVYLCLSVAKNSKREQLGYRVVRGQSSVVAHHNWGVRYNTWPLTRISVSTKYSCNPARFTVMPSPGAAGAWT